MTSFTIEVNGMRAKYGSLDAIANFCFEMGRTKRAAAGMVRDTRQYYAGQADTFDHLGVVLESVNIDGMQVHRYIEELGGLLKASRGIADTLAADLRKANERIAELEKILADPEKR